MASASFGASGWRGAVAAIDAVHKFHQEIEQAVGLAELVERDDVRMIELGQGLGFAGETFGESRISAGLGGRILSATSRSSCFCRAL